MAYEFREVKYDDIFTHMRIRNEQLEILRHREIVTKEHQINWYHKVIEPSQATEKPITKIFTILYNGKIIGNGGLCYINYEDKKAEISFIVEKSRTELEFANDFKEYVNYMREYGFKKLGLHRIYAEVYDIRKQMITLLEKNGFQHEGTLKDNVCIDGVFHNSLMYGLINNS